MAVISEDEKYRQDQIRKAVEAKAKAKSTPPPAGPKYATNPTQYAGYYSPGVAYGSANTTANASGSPDERQEAKATSKLTMTYRGYFSPVDAPNMQQLAEQAKAPFASNPALEYGTKIGDRLYYTEDHQMLTNKPGGVPARLTIANEIAPAEIGQRAITLTDTLMKTLPKAAYVDATVKFGDTLYQDIDEANWPKLTNRPSATATMVTDEKGNPIVYNTIWMSMLTGKKPPTPSLSLDIKAGKPMYYDPVLNQYTNKVTEYAVTPDGIGGEGAPVTYTEELGAILTGQLSREQMSVGKFKAGDPIYYDYATNQFTAEHTPTAAPLYMVLTNKQALLSSKDAVAQYEFTTTPNGSPAKWDTNTEKMLTVLRPGVEKAVNAWIDAENLDKLQPVEATDEIGREYSTWEKINGYPDATTYKSKEVEGGVVSVSNPAPWKLVTWVRNLFGLGEARVNDSTMSVVQESALIPEQMVGRSISSPAYRYEGYQVRMLTDEEHELQVQGVKNTLNVLMKVTYGLGWLFSWVTTKPAAWRVADYNKLRAGEDASWFGADLFINQEKQPRWLVSTLAQADKFINEAAKESYSDMVLFAKSTFTGQPQTAVTAPKSQTELLYYDREFAQDVANYGMFKARDIHAQRAKVLYDKAFAYAAQQNETEAKKLIKEAIYEERLGAGAIDPYFAISWLRDPKREESFLNLAADVIYQKQKPLTRNEILDLQNYKTDPTVELPWQLTFDLLNIPIVTAPLAIGAKFLGKAIGGTLKVTGKGIMAIPHVGPWVDKVIVNGVFNRAVRSTAAKTFQAVFDPVARIAQPGHSLGWMGGEGTVAAHLGKLGDLIVEYRAAIEAGEAIDFLKMLRKSGVPLAIDATSAKRLLLAADVIPPEKWGTLAENVIEHLIDEGVSEAMNINWVNKANDMLRAGTLSEDAIQTGVDTARVAGSTLSDKALRKEVMVELAKKIQSPSIRQQVSNSITQHQFAGAFSQRFQAQVLRNNAAWGGSAILKGSLASFIGNAYPDARKALDGIANTSNFITQLWVTATLARRPAWVVFNTIDNLARMAFATASLVLNPIETLQMWFTDYGKMIDKLGILPAELGMSITREGIGQKASVSWKVVEHPILASPISLPGHYLINLMEGHRNGTFFLKNLIQSYPNAIYDLNQAIEFSNRLRLFYGKMLKNIDILEGKVKPGVIKSLEKSLQKAGLNEQEIALWTERMEDLWEMAGNDPDKLKAISNLENFAVGTEAMSLWITKGILRDELLMNMEDRYLLFGAIRKQFEAFLQSRKGTVLTPDDIDEFFDGVLRAFQDEVARQLDPDGGYALSRAWREGLVDEADEIAASMKATGMSDKVIDFMMTDPEHLPEKFSPNLRKALADAFGKGQGISTKGKTVQEAWDEMRKMWGKRLSDIMGDDGGMMDKLDTHNRWLKEMEAQADEVSPVDPIRRMAAEKQKKSFAAVEAEISAMPDAERATTGANRHDLVRDWDHAQGVLDKFYLFAFPGPKMKNYGQKRGKAWDMWEMLMSRSYEAGERYGNDIRGGMDKRLTLSEFLERHGWKINFDENGNIIAGGTIPHPMHRETTHRMGNWETTQFKMDFGVVTKADMDEPMSLAKYVQTPAGRAAVSLDNMKSLDDLRAASPRVEAAMKRLEEAADEVAQKAARREVNRQIIAEFNLVDFDKIVTATKDGVNNDIPLIKTVNKYLDLEGAAAYANDAFDQIPPEDVWKALNNRRTARANFEIPEWTSDFRDEMIHVLQHQYHMSEKKARSVMAVYDAAAKVWGKRYGRKPQEFWHTVFSGFYSEGTMSDVWGSTQWVDNGKAVVKAYGKANINTTLHEFFHALRGNPMDAKAVSWIPEADIKILDDWSMPIAKAKLGEKASEADVVRESLEIQAKGFEKYLKDHTAPTRGLAKVFADMKVWFTEIYRSVRNYFDFGDLPEDVVKVYDRLLTDQIATETGKVKKATADAIKNAPPMTSEKYYTTLNQWDDAWTKYLADLPGDVRGTVAGIVNELQKFGYTPEQIALLGTPERMLAKLQEEIAKRGDNLDDLPESLKQTIRQEEKVDPYAPYKVMENGKETIRLSGGWKMVQDDAPPVWEVENWGDGTSRHTYRLAADQVVNVYPVRSGGYALMAFGGSWDMGKDFGKYDSLDEAKRVAEQVGNDEFSRVQKYTLVDPAGNRGESYINLRVAEQNALKENSLMMIPPKQLAESGIIDTETFDIRANSVYFVYRGMDRGAIEDVVATGAVKSNNAGNLTDHLDTTRYSENPRTARSYATTFSMKDFRPTPERPGYVIEVNKGADVYKDYSLNEAYTLDALPAERITRVTEYKPRGTSPDEIYDYIETDVTDKFKKSLEQGRMLFQTIQSEPGPVWYSQLQRTVENISQERMTVEQAKALIQKNGVKADELKWTGIMDWLDEMPAGARVTKSEMLDYLSQNNVQVEERLLGDTYVPGVNAKYGAYVDGVLMATDSDRVRLERTMTGYRNYQIMPVVSGDVQYADYALPGKSNYRELLFSMPNKNANAQNEIRRLSDRLDVIRRERAEINAVDDISSEEDYLQLSNSKRSLELEEQQIKRQIVELRIKRADGVVYKSPHFTNGENLLAHVRFDDRVDVDGKRVLFIEEVQSDWHQAGREKGYKADVRHMTNSEYDEFQTLQWNRNDKTYKWTQEEQKRLEELTDIYQAEQRNLNAPPEAPFAKTWPDMVMKRMIRWASENGYDRVAWTTGAQQAQRYDLRNFVDELRWEKSGDSDVSIVGVKDGQPVVTRDVASKDLADTIGKEAAEKITSSAETKGTLSGENLAVGGHGMEQFYDVMLPSAMNKYLKKWGVQVDSTGIATGIASPGADVVRVSDDGTVTSYATFSSVERASANISNVARDYKIPESSLSVRANPETYSEVHSFDVTPAMRDSVMQGQPLFQKIERSEDLTEFWKAYKQVNRYGKYSLDSIFKALFGEDIDLDDPIDALIEMEKLADKYADAGLEKQAKIVKALHDEAESVLQAVQDGVVKGKSNVVPPVPEWILSENIQTWIANQRIAAGNYEAVVRLIRDMKAHAKEAVSQGKWWTKQAPDNVVKAFQEWGDEAAVAKADLLSEAAWGGKSVDGAVAWTNHWMLDYTDYSNFDSFMRNALFPFWMFPSRSLPLWIETFLQTPEIPAAYFKYLQYSKRKALQAGATNSYGEQLPSLVGYIPIPGTDVWFNPTAPLSFRYLIPLNNGYYDNDREGTGLVENVFTWLLNTSQTMGMYFSPLVMFALLQGSNQENYGFFSAGYEVGKTIFPIPPEFFPPWVQRAIGEKIRKNLVSQWPDLWKPEVTWKDYLIERNMLSETLYEIQSMRDDDERKWLKVNEVMAVLKDPERESNPMWIKYRNELEASDYYRQLGGFITGFYVKEFTPAYAELLRLRDDLNNLRDSINNEVQAQLFDLLPGAVARYESYNEKRYNTPEGWLWDGYTKIRWVVDDDGNQLQGDARRQAIAEQFAYDQKVRDYQLARQMVFNAYNARLRAIPAGAPSDAYNAVYTWLGKQLSALDAETDKDAIKEWTIGNKPTVLLEEHFTKEWWKLLSETRPPWDEDVPYAEYQQKVEDWKASLPLIAKAMMPGFIARMETFQLKLQPGQTLANIPEKLMKETNGSGYDKYKLGTDSIYDAIADAWTALYAEDFWNIVYDPNLTNSEKELQKAIFYEKHPNPPTEAEMWKWITDTYGSKKFSRNELKMAMVGKETLTMQDRFDYGKTDFEKLDNQKQEIFKMLTANDLWGEAYKLNRELGGRDGDFDSGKEFKDPEDYMAFLERLKQIQERLGLNTPSIGQLEKVVVADKLETQMDEEAEARFGDDIHELEQHYMNLDESQQKAWRKANPSEYLRLKNMWAFEKQFKSEHPEMEIVPEGGAVASSSGSSSGGGGSGGYSGGGGKSGGGGGKSSGGGGSSSSTGTPVAGFRSTTDARVLLAPGMLGKGGYAKRPVWPKEMIASVSPMLTEEVQQFVDNGDPLSASAIEYLKGLLERHPEWASTIQPILDLVNAQNLPSSGSNLT